jgi:glycosyltransferase involved in cell wall biosynthesis
MPFFSIIIPTYNRAPIISLSINAVLQQTFDDFEIIVVDDGSTDQTSDVVGSILNPKLSYVYQDNQGVCAARNTGARCAKGQYLAFLDSDDFVEMNWLEDFHKKIIQEKTSLVYCSIQKVEPNGNVTVINANNPFNNGRSKGVLLAGAWVLEAAIFFKVGLYDENLKFGENTELRIRLDKLKISPSIVTNYNLVYNSCFSEGAKNNQNKFDSILYTISKHKSYFDSNPRLKKLQLQTAAVAAVRIGLYQKANQLFGKILLENLTDIKAWLRYLISLNRALAKNTWKNNF